MSPESTSLRAPIVDVAATKPIATGVWVIPDANRTPFVPNIGIVVGSRAALVIDTGFGAANARAVMDRARGVAGSLPIFLTHTHCHPEHGFGANIIAGEGTVVYNATQWSELQEKGPSILRAFRDKLPPFAAMLDGVEFVRPQLLYSGSLDLDLGGGLVVELREFGGAHSRGDQAIFVRGPTSVFFAGDLIEEGAFGVIADNESRVIPWIERLRQFESIAPDLVVPGHGRLGGLEMIGEYRACFELAVRRVAVLRAEGVKEGETVERVTAELLDLHPDWTNRKGARDAISSLSWPSLA